MSEIGLIGKKIGMSREFFKTGQSIPVTVLKVEKARVIQLINKEKRVRSWRRLYYPTIQTRWITFSGGNY